jgi:Domain of unknown function (DUF5597)
MNSPARLRARSHASTLKASYRVFRKKTANPSQILDFGTWQAVISYGLGQFGRRAEPPGNPEPSGRAFIAQLGPDEFLVSGFFCRVDFRPADTNKQRVFLRAEEGTYKNGTFQPIRIWNGDQTDWGLNFTSVPQVLRVKLGRF